MRSALSQEEQSDTFITFQKTPARKKIGVSWFLCQPDLLSKTTTNNALGFRNGIMPDGRALETVTSSIMFSGSSDRLILHIGKAWAVCFGRFGTICQ